MATINGIQAMSWAQFSKIANGTRILNYYYDQCVALANLYSQGVVGASFAAVASAFQWWTNFDALGLGRWYVKSSTPVPGAIFVAKGWPYNSVDGHIGVVHAVSGNTIYTYEQNSEVNRYFARCQRNASTSIYGYLIPRNNPATPALTETQRRAGANPVRRRFAASSSSKELQPPLKPGEVGNFKGFVKGQKVTDAVASTDIWFVGISGNYFWAGGFTNQSTKGLKYLTPRKPGERTVGKNPVKRRTGPTTASKDLQNPLKPGQTVEFAGWAEGQLVDDGIAKTSLWYVGKSGNCFWAGGFTNISKAGLKDLTPAKPEPPPVKPPEVTYVPPKIMELGPADFPKWISFDTVQDAEAKGETAKSWNMGLFDYYAAKGQKKQYAPEEVHVHWWGEPGTGLTHDGTVSYISKTEGLTVNFVLSAGRVTSMLPLTWCATTTGMRNPWGWKIEADPSLTEDVYKTMGALVFLVERKTAALKGEPIRLHKDFMATACSQIDVAKVRMWAERFASKEWSINTGEKASAPSKLPVTITIVVDESGEWRAQ